MVFRSIQTFRVQYHHEEVKQSIMIAANLQSTMGASYGPNLGQISPNWAFFFNISVHYIFAHQHNGKGSYLSHL